MTNYTINLITESSTFFLEWMGKSSWCFSTCFHVQTVCILNFVRFWAFCLLTFSLFLYVPMFYCWGLVHSSGLRGRGVENFIIENFMDVSMCLNVLSLLKVFTCRSKLSHSRLLLKGVAQPQCGKRLIFLYRFYQIHPMCQSE